MFYRKLYPIARSLGRAAGAAAMTAALLPATLAAASSLGGDLPRRADPGFATEARDGRLLVARLDPESAAASAGLTEGATLLAIAGIEVADPRQGAELLRRRADGGVPLTLRWATPDGGERTATYTPPPLPLEEIPGVETLYDAVELPDGARLRTLVSRPAGTTGPLPALFFTQWVSCGSIEYRAGSTARETLAALGRESGLVLLRVERSSDGDSEGPACHELDYETELAHYRAAFDHLMSHPWVDRDHVVVLGSSLGSTVAVLLAQGVQADGGHISGVAVQGGGAVTYVERMFTFDRFHLERSPEVDPATIHEEMLARILFQTEYLIRGRHPDAIATDSERMARVRRSIRGLEHDTQYGRPFAWHQQAARRDFLGAWAAVDAPVLVIYNGLDQFEGRHGHRTIVDLVNRLRPGTATWVERPNLGHSDYVFADAEAAYADVDGVPAPRLKIEAILEWLRSLDLPSGPALPGGD